MRLIKARVVGAQNRRIDPPSEAIVSFGQQWRFDWPKRWLEATNFKIRAQFVYFA